MTELRKACQVCGTDIPAALEEHHIIPRSEEDKDDLWNKVYLCSNCHKLVHKYKQLERKAMLQKGRAILLEKLPTEKQDLISVIFPEYTCDRCGQLRKANRGGYYWIQSVFYPVGGREKIKERVLCHECHQSLEAWFEKRD